MKINVTVKPNAKKQKVESLPNGDYRVFVTAPAREGKANEALMEILAAHFGVKKSAVHIQLGAHYKTKVIRINFE